LISMLVAAVWICYACMSFRNTTHSNYQWNLNDVNIFQQVRKSAQAAL
jgi:hypothetical protein